MISCTQLNYRSVSVQIGVQLKQARQAANMTQEEVAKELFVTRQTVSRWEQDHNLPNIYVLKDLSQLYQVDISSFFEEEGERESTRKKVHLWALLGLFVFNALFFAIAYFTMLVILISFWLLALGFVLIPVFALFHQETIYMVINNQRLTPGWGLKLLLFLLGLGMLPLMFFATKQIWRFTRHYVRYNIKSVYY